LNEGINKLIELERQNLERLEAVEEAVRETVPEGIVVPRTISVVERETVDFRTEPLFSFSLYNDGDDDVYVGGSTYPEEEVPVKKKESYDCPIRKRGSIKMIYLVCGKGKSTSVRIYGVR